jgi:hypothetical protein
MSPSWRDPLRLLIAFLLGVLVALAVVALLPEPVQVVEYVRTVRCEWFVTVR